MFINGSPLGFAWIEGSLKLWVIKETWKLTGIFLKTFCDEVDEKTRQNLPEFF